MEVTQMTDQQPVRCQKCGKPIGYITVQARTLLGTQPIQDTKIVAVCVNCHQKKFTVP